MKWNHVISLLCIIPHLLSAFYSDEPEKKVHDKSIVVVDCGSSGTRAHWFLSANIGDRNAQIHVPDFGDTESFYSSPGISYFANDLDGLRGYFRSLLSNVESSINFKRSTTSSILRETDVYVFATAGLRLLHEHDQSAIMNTIENVLMESEFRAYQVRIISGKEEAVLAWLGQNFLLKNIRPGKPTNFHKLVGVHEMGGASSQEANAVLTVGECSQQVNHVSYYNDTFLVCSRSHLGLGLNEAKKKYSANLLTHYGLSADPCLPMGFEVAINEDLLPGVKIKGSSYKGSCKSRVVEIFPNIMRITDHPSHFVVGISNFFHAFSGIARKEDYILEDILKLPLNENQMVSIKSTPLVRLTTIYDHSLLTIEVQYKKENISLSGRIEDSYLLLKKEDESLKISGEFVNDTLTIVFVAQETVDSFARSLTVKEYDEKAAEFCDLTWEEIKDAYAKYRRSISTPESLCFKATYAAVSLVSAHGLTDDTEIMVRDEDYSAWVVGAAMKIYEGLDSKWAPTTCNQSILKELYVPRRHDDILSPDLVFGSGTTTPPPLSSPPSSLIVSSIVDAASLTTNLEANASRDVASDSDRNGVGGDNDNHETRDDTEGVDGSARSDFGDDGRSCEKPAPWGGRKWLQL